MLLSAQTGRREATVSSVGYHGNCLPIHLRGRVDKLGRHLGCWRRPVGGSLCVMYSMASQYRGGLSGVTKEMEISQDNHTIAH